MTGARTGPARPKVGPSRRADAPQAPGAERDRSGSPDATDAPPRRAGAGASRQQLGYLAPRRIRNAYDALIQDEVAKGTPDLRVSARVDPGILEAAARNLGLTQPSDVVNAAIIAAAVQDPFKAWFLTAAGVLPDDFELPV